LMIATTSFIGQPFGSPSFQKSPLSRGSSKSGIFWGKWHKKLAAISGFLSPCDLQALYRAPRSPSEYGYDFRRYRRAGHVF
jgi:hypothetical protein